MSEVQSASNTLRLPDRGAPFFVPTADIERHWSAIEFVLKQTENWTQAIAATEIFDYLKDGRAQAWGIIDQADQLSLIITRLTDTARGRLCTAWVFIPVSAQDEASIGALLDSVEAYARSKAAVALEMTTAPWLAEKINAHLSRAKATAAILELDLRSPRSTN